MKNTEFLEFEVDLHELSSRAAIMRLSLRAILEDDMSEDELMGLISLSDDVVSLTKELIMKSVRIRIDANRSNFQPLANISLGAAK